MNQKAYTAFYLVMTHLASLVVIFFWYVAAFLAVPMSFDSGLKMGMLLADVVALLLPIVFEVVPALLSWMAWSKRKFVRAFMWSIPNWVAIFLVFAYFIWH